ncbi:MAG: serine/threonine protein kinase [Myxococcales bacterium]|nr:serine/threonine protein kinase [Myxococcales bacterium]
MASLVVGSIFAGEWRVLARLAEGGMGTVYRVEQCSTGQLRALKVLRAGLWEDGRARERFEREALVVSKFASEHITRVIAAGIDPDEGAPWIAMELLEGETLKKRVDREGPFGRLEALELARQLCHALAAAHEAGVVHRDLKPENIFIARSSRVGGQEVVKLLDFGIATALEEFETSATVTSVIGSPLWMAPEQVRRERIKPATDVWALGLLMFWALTGKAYWRKTFPADAVLFEKMVEPLVPASQRAVELACNDALPPGFDPWFARCVSRKIDERYRDAEEAFDAFERVMTDPRMPRDLPRSKSAIAAWFAATAVAAASIAWVARPYLSSTGGATLPPLRMNLALVGADATTPTDASQRMFDSGFADASTTTRDATREARTDDAAVTRDVTRDAPTDTRVESTPARPPRPTSSADASTQTAAPGALGSAPLVAGFVVRRFPTAQSLCTQRATTHPWQLVPDWYLDRRASLRLEERARRLRLERSMIARITDPTQQSAAVRSVEEQQEHLDRDRAMVEQEIQRSLPTLRASLSQRARDARCVDVGLRVDIDALYATWCCR